MRVMGFSFRSAAWLKEWRQVRWWWMVALILMNAPVEAAMIRCLEAPRAFSQGAVNAAANFLWNGMYGILFGVSQSPVPVSHFQTAAVETSVGFYAFSGGVALAFALWQMAGDRDTWQYVCSLPLRKRDLYWAKWLFGASLAVISALLPVVYLIVGQMISGTHFPVAWILYWGGLNLLLWLVMLSIGYVCGGVFGQYSAALLGSVVTVTLPLQLSAFLLAILNEFPSPPAVAPLLPESALGVVAHFVARFSPFYYASNNSLPTTSVASGGPGQATHTITYVSGVIGNGSWLGNNDLSGTLMALFFVAWVILFAWLGLRLYGSLTADCDAFIRFAAAEYLVVVYVSFVIGTVAGILVQRMPTGLNAPFLPVALVVAALSMLCYSGFRALLRSKRTRQGQRTVRV